MKKNYLSIISLIAFLILILLFSVSHKNTSEMIDMTTLDFISAQTDNENIKLKYQDYLEKNISYNLMSFESIADASVEIDQSEEACLITVSIKLQRESIAITPDEKEAIENYVLKVLTPLYPNAELTINITNISGTPTGMGI